ncbi:MAG: hypothetical protein K8J08_08475 [Thermoanaerobaculia bacterium]|nr:hypothetical protein [Thermoanaerobaculia bacterium]
MTRTIRTLTLVTTLAVFSAPAMPAQTGPGKGKGTPKYDSKTETTVAGTIESVDYPDSPKGWQGVHLQVRVGEETHAVHLGPRWYVEEQGFTFAPDDLVEVVASRVQCQGEDALLARTITRGDDVLELRDEAGRPRWSRRSGSRPQS